MNLFPYFPGVSDPSQERNEVKPFKSTIFYNDQISQLSLLFQAQYRRSSGVLSVRLHLSRAVLVYDGVKKNT